MATDDADRRAKEVVDELDAIARGVCHYDYGLPLYDAIAGPHLRGVVATAIRAAVDAYRQRVCAVLADALPGAADLLRREGKE